MDSSDLIIICITLLLSAFFSGVEIAFVSSNRLKIELDRASGSLNGRIVGYFYNKEENFIAALSLGNNLSLVLFGLSIARLLRLPHIINPNVYCNHHCFDCCRVFSQSDLPIESQSIHEVFGNTFFCILLDSFYPHINYAVFQRLVF